MIIWGGFTSFDFGSFYTGTGGRYSPISDTWNGTAVGPNAPSERAYHSAIWTGSKMIVFGGFFETLGLGPTLNTGGIYSPETDNIVLDPPSLPNPEVNVPYSETISPSGGAPPYTFSKVEGTLPQGLAFDESSGVISGTPQSGGERSIFAITATDTNSCPGSRGYFLRVCPEMIFSPSSLPVGVVGRIYNQTISVSGIVAPYSFSITAGILPDGLVLNAATGVVSGIPTSGGRFNFTITVVDIWACTKSHDYIINVLSTHS